MINVYYTCTQNTVWMCIVPVQIYNNHCLLFLNDIMFIISSNTHKHTHTTHTELCKISICTHGSALGAAYMPTDAVCQASLKSSSFLKPPYTRAHNCSAGFPIKQMNTVNPLVSIPMLFPDAVGRNAGGLVTIIRNAAQNGKYNWKQCTHNSSLLCHFSCTFL